MHSALGDTALSPLFPSGDRWFERDVALATVRTESDVASGSVRVPANETFSFTDFSGFTESMKLSDDEVAEVSNGQ